MPHLHNHPDITGCMHRALSSTNIILRKIDSIILIIKGDTDKYMCMKRLITASDVGMVVQVWHVVLVLYLLLLHVGVAAKCTLLPPSVHKRSAG